MSETLREELHELRSELALLREEIQKVYSRLPEPSSVASLEPPIKPAMHERMNELIIKWANHQLDSEMCADELDDLINPQIALGSG